MSTSTHSFQTVKAAETDRLRRQIRSFIRAKVPQCVFNHMSKTALKYVLLHTLCNHLQKDWSWNNPSNIGYEASQWLFEGLFERQLGLWMNGHHLAQAFSEHMMPDIEAVQMAMHARDHEDSQPEG